MKTTNLLLVSSVLFMQMSAVRPAFGQGTGFTYQGHLYDGAGPANGNYDMRFQLWNALTGGATVTGFVTNAPIAVSNGLFTTVIDFGAGVFTGPALWLHLGVRTNGSASGYTSLAPRQELTPTPYAIFAESANATNLVGTVPPGSVSVSSLPADVALTDANQRFTGNNSFSTNVGIGTTVAPQQYLSVRGGVNIDQANNNGGFINNGNTNGYSLTFGSSSGEGIASQRQATGNQYGLDFYTSFAQRMSLNNSGNLMLDGNDMYLLEGNTWNGLGYRTSVAGISPSGGQGIFVYGLDAGYLGTRNPDAVALTWDWHNNVNVTGEYLVVNGLTPVNAYIGDDGVANDVQVGSQKSGITHVSFYNTADNAFMHIYCSSITINGGADLAEPFKISPADQDIPQGAVVVIDEQNPGHLKLSDHSYDTRVAGVISGANGINPGIQMQQQGLVEGGKNVALTGRVYVQADTSNGIIKPGDLLTTSKIPGHAMKVTDHARAAGAILGKAMTGLSAGKGTVLVLVTLQ